MNEPRQVAENLKELWSPRIIAEVDDSFVKVAKIKGEFPWHSHEMEDELFMVLEGEMSIELEDSHVKLTTGDLYVVPKGTAHRPSAAEECLILLFEKKSTRHTGDLVQENTRSVEQQRVQE